VPAANLQKSNFGPFYLSGADGPPEPGPDVVFEPTADQRACVVSNLVLDVYFRGVDSAAVNSPDRDFGGTSPRLSLLKHSSSGTVFQTMIEGKPVTGHRVGTSCTGAGFLRLTDTASLSVLDAPQPYSGTFKPTGAGGMALFNGLESASRWSLEMSNLNGPVVIQCWVLTLSLVAPTAP